MTDVAPGGNAGTAPVDPPVAASGYISTRSFVGQRITQIQEGYVRAAQSAESRAALARLRRGVGHELGVIADVLPYVVNERGPRPRSEAPTPDERAIYLAMTLYAVHQQSRGERMHVRGMSFGSALGSLRFVDGKENPGVVRRFQALGTAGSLAEFETHARALITLLRRAGRGFDYGQFADDLVGFQNPKRAPQIRLAWGRDFYRVPRTTEASEEES